MQRFEQEDQKHGRARGTRSIAEGVPPSSSDAPDKSQQTHRGRAFGVRIEDLEMVQTSEGQQVPKVLLALKENIGDASAPQIFVKSADASTKASARAGLDDCNFEGWSAESDVAANLLLDWFGEYPGELGTPLSDSS